jgi:hypothetical protein
MDEGLSGVSGVRGDRHLAFDYFAHAHFLPVVIKFLAAV